MDFNDTPEEAAFREEARSWLASKASLLKPGQRRAAPLGEGTKGLLKKAREWQATKADDGWACITWPKEYGGRGATSIQSAIWNQEEAKFDVPPNLFSIGQGMLAPTIMAHGTQEQKDLYLEKILRADEIWCQLFSEPAAGSDLAGLRTTAVKDGDDWIINGQKIWTSGAHYSDRGMIVCRTDPTAKKHAGITYFIVDMDAPGVETRGIKQISGTSDFNEVFFTDVRVPDGNRVGAVNDGWRGAITTLMNERATIGAGGAFGAGIKDLIELAKNTPWNGRPAIEDPAVRQKIADYYVKLKGLEYTGLRTLTALSQGKTPGPENAIGKMVGAPLRQEMSAFAMELQGEAGILTDASVAAAGGGFQQGYLASPGLRLAGGTDEILHNILAERVLGLPGEVRVDKDLAFQDIPTGRS
ncbi:MAG: acyl-CoA dehydrogenase family protein [Myxococcota bacterium]